VEYRFFDRNEEEISLERADAKDTPVKEKG
jgi:hypothetical protein